VQKKITLPVRSVYFILILHKKTHKNTHHRIFNNAYVVVKVQQRLWNTGVTGHFGPDTRQQHNKRNILPLYEYVLNFTRPICTCVYVLRYEGKCKWSYGPSCPVNFSLNIPVFISQLGRYRFCKSVSVFVFLVGFSKVGIGFGIGFSKYRDIGFGFRFFRTNLPLLIE